MKRLLLITLLFAICGTLTFGQGLFHPIDQNMFKTDGWAVRKDLKPSAWIPRISAGVQATQWTLDAGKIQQQAFNKVGLGLSYAHFIEINGLPYNNVSLNAFAFFPTDGGTKITLALTTSVLEYIQVGFDWDFQLNKPGLLTGIVYRF